MIVDHCQRWGGGRASYRPAGEPIETARPQHRWAWGMEAGGRVRRTAVVVVQWVEGRDGPLLRTGTSAPLLATFCVCEHCGTVRADVEHPDGGPALHAYGVDAEGLLAGAGAPSCGVQIPRREGEGGDLVSDPTSNGEAGAPPAASTPRKAGPL